MHIDDVVCDGGVQGAINHRTRRERGREYWRTGYIGTPGWIYAPTISGDGRMLVPVERWKKERTREGVVCEFETS